MSGSVEATLEEIPGTERRRTVPVFIHRGGEIRNVDLTVVSKLARLLYREEPNEDIVMPATTFEVCFEGRTLIVVNNAAGAGSTPGGPWRTRLAASLAGDRVDAASGADLAVELFGVR